MYHNYYAVEIFLADRHKEIYAQSNRSKQLDIINRPEGKRSVKWSLIGIISALQELFTRKEVSIHSVVSTPTEIISQGDQISQECQPC
jgi:hypothetical protein